MSTTRKTQTDSRLRDLGARFATRGTTLFSVARRSRDGVVVGARYFVSTGPNEIEEVTWMVAIVLGCPWDRKTGYMKTRAISDAVDLLGIRVFDDPRAYRHKSLI